MSFEKFDNDVPTKAKLIILVFPDKIMPVEGRPYSEKTRYTKNAKELITFEESTRAGTGTFLYKLPGKAIALEEYSDYFVVNIGMSADEKLLHKVLEIATFKERGLILRPPANVKHLALDSPILKYNELNGYESMRF
jgi:hypothetical protein